MNKSKGVVLLTSLIILSLLSSISLIHLSSVMTSQKAAFAHEQYYRSGEYATRGLSDAIKNVLECELIRSGSYEDEGGSYTYTIEDYVQENIYAATSTGTTLDVFKSTQRIVFTFDTEKFNPNNGWGNGDQDAPGNSLNNNNAENNQNGREAPKGIQKKREKEKDNGKKCKDVSVVILSWADL